MVVDTDLHIGHLPLVLLSTIVAKADKAIVFPVASKLLPSALTLLQSPLLQGCAPH